MRKKIEKDTLIKILDCCIEDDCFHCPNAYKDSSIAACEAVARGSVHIPFSIMRETIEALKAQPEGNHVDMEANSRKKVIKGLELLHDRLLDAAKQKAVAKLDASIVADAITLLKEQEALPIVYQNNECTGLPVARCPSCGEPLVQFHSGVDGKESKFCYYCGREVKWE